MRRTLAITLVSTLFALAWTGCGDDGGGGGAKPVDPDTAPEASIDRFSDDAATLFKRSANASLPAADEAIDFDQAPFITKGLGPNGEVIEYYNFDVQPVTPAPIFVLFREGETAPVDGQLNIVDDIPGDADYNDFWHVHKVTVPADYVANTVTSLDEITAAGYTVTPTDMLVNCPIVPEGSTATKRLNGADAGLTRGWYRGMVVYYFEFNEASLTVDPSSPVVPGADIFVTFNVNPDPMDPASGPASGFMTEMGTDQTHNVADSVPGDMDYSPYWVVNIYDNTDFGTVSDLSSAEMATSIGPGPNVNCPVVSVM